MSTNHTTRAAVRAGAFTAVLAGLLLGAPTAFADPPTPTPPPPNNNTPSPDHSLTGTGSNNACPACAYNPPYVEATNSGSGGEILALYGNNWHPGDTVKLFVSQTPNAGNYSWESSPVPVQADGTIPSTNTGCTTAAGLPANAFAGAIDTTRQASATPVPVVIALAPGGKLQCHS